jgi:hypothetical protein
MVGLGLSMEDGGIQDDVGDVVQDVFLDLDEVRLSECNNLDWLDWLAGGIFKVLNLCIQIGLRESLIINGNDPDQINIRHRLAH